MTGLRAGANNQTTFSHLKLDQLDSRLESLPVVNLSSVNLTKRLYVKRLIKKAKQAHIADTPQLLVNILQKAEYALEALEQNLQKEQQQAEEQLGIIEEDYAHVLDNAQSLFDEGAFLSLTALFKSVHHKKNAHLFKMLVSEMGRGEFNALASDSPEMKDKKSKPTELQSFQQYQTMFEKMALDRLLSRVMQEIPKNAGPLNPERLVIRSFKALQDISPDYLSRLLVYYESLLMLQLLNNIEK